MTTLNDIEDYMSNQIENAIPEEDGIELDEVEKCEMCLEYTDCFVIHKDHIICNDCIENQEKLTIDELVEIIEKNKR